jgi:hypothetical protein
MKAICVIVLLSVVISIMTPLHITIVAIENEGDTMICILDVCNTSGLFLSSNSESPSLYETQFAFLISYLTSYYDYDNSISKPSVVLFQKERPPKYPVA